MKLAFVIQRYGDTIPGGAETLCRQVVEHLSAHHQIEVLTTCAVDYLTWKNELPEQLDLVNNIPVRRFKVAKERNTRRFGMIQNAIVNNVHTRRDELKWLKEEGPYSPSLIRHIRKWRNRYDLFFFFCYRYYTSFHGLHEVADRAVLVPTAEHDEIIHLDIFRDFFRRPRGMVYLTPEEKILVESVSGNEEVVSDVIGGLDKMPVQTDADRFREHYGVSGEYMLYLGRVDENKGCRTLFSHFIRFAAERRSSMKLVVAGHPVMKIPDHPNIVHLGYLPEEMKYAALTGCRFLVMPSQYESLCMVILEAWALGKPVLVNSRCDVLRGQVTRSNGGLYFGTFEEFLFTVQLLTSHPKLRASLGRSGRAYVQRHYNWDRIISRYLKLIDRLTGEKKNENRRRPRRRQASPSPRGRNTPKQKPRVNGRQSKPEGSAEPGRR